MCRAYGHGKAAYVRLCVRTGSKGLKARGPGRPSRICAGAWEDLKAAQAHAAPFVKPALGALRKAEVTYVPDESAATEDRDNNPLSEFEG